MGDVMAFACDDEKEKTPTELLLTNSLRREHEVTYIHTYIHTYICTASHQQLEERT
jgi:hypothetical protein